MCLRSTNFRLRIPVAEITVTRRTLAVGSRGGSWVVKSMRNIHLSAIMALPLALFTLLGLTLLIHSYAFKSRQYL